MPTDDPPLDRLRAMLDDDGQTWDLSPNDKAAIGWAIKQAELVASGVEGTVEGRGPVWADERHKRLLMSFLVHSDIELDTGPPMGSRVLILPHPATPTEEIR